MLHKLLIGMDVASHYLAVAPQSGKKKILLHCFLHNFKFKVWSSESI